MITIITGKSATGKTTKALALSIEKHTNVLHTDTYLKYSREHMYDQMMHDILEQSATQDLIVEGIDALKLITKYSLKYNELIVLYSSDEVRDERHFERGTERNLGQDKYFDNILNLI